MKLKIYLNLIAAAFSVIIMSCGEGTVEVGPQTYTPKIVIEGYLQPGYDIEVLITRNIPLNTQIDPSSVILSDADVVITDLQTNKDYALTYNPASGKFRYTGTDLVIDYDKSYKLTVNAVIDGKQLSAASATRVPKEGFSILRNESLLGTMKYREADNEGNVKKFKIVFNTSAGTTYYAISNIALDASLETFVYDNPYFDMDREDLEDDMAQFKYQMRWIQNANPNGGKRDFEIDWLDLWFYSSYRLIVYAGDENFRLFVQTYGNVTEFDGNLHEPRFNITGDGIGIFGSYIADTVYVKVEQ
jgi:hypothetical protein